MSELNAIDRDGILECNLPDVYLKDKDLVERLIQEEDFTELRKIIPKDCVFCDSPTCHQRNPQNRCSRCVNHYYCNRDCQKEHFQRHKQKCKCLAEVGKTGVTLFDEEDLISYPDEMGTSRVKIDWDNQENPLNDNCQICLKDAVSPEDVIVLPCRHAFCAACIMEWQKGTFLKRIELQKGDACPTCREPMPIVEAQLTMRANELRNQAKAMDKDQCEKRRKLVGEALGVMAKIISYSECQRTARISMAELLIDAGQPLDAAKQINILMEYHYRVSEQPLTRVCAEYEAALKAGETKKAEKLMEKMEFMAPRMDPNYTAPFELIQEAYRVQARAYMEAKEWKLALSVINDKLFGFAWSLLPESSPRSRNHEYLLGTGRCLFEMGDFKDAVDPLQMTLLLSRDIPSDSYKYLALAYKASGNLEAALVTMNKAVLYIGNHPKYCEQVCMLYRELLKEWKLETHAKANK